MRAQFHTCLHLTLCIQGPLRTQLSEAVAARAELEQQTALRMREIQKRFKAVQEGRSAAEAEVTTLREANKVRVERMPMPGGMEHQYRCHQVEGTYGTDWNLDATKGNMMWAARLCVLVRVEGIESATSEAMTQREPATYAPHPHLCIFHGYAM